MYNNAEVGDFGNPETKLKQMQLKLTESDLKFQQMKNENMGLKRKLANVEKRVPDALSDEL